MGRQERETTVATPDIELRCRVAGPADPDAPLVIAAHGFPDGERTFRHQVEALTAAGYRVATPTMRGYAPSGSGPCHAIALGRDLLAVAEQLGGREPVRLSGHELGGGGGIRGGRARADALQPSGHHRRPASARAVARVAVSGAAAPLLVHRRVSAAARRRTAAGATRSGAGGSAVARLVAGLSLPARRDARIKEAIAPRIPEVLRYYRDIAHPANRRERERLLSACQVPALYLHGNDDGCIGVEVLAGMQRAFSHGIELQVMEGWSLRSSRASRARQRASVAVFREGQGAMTTAVVGFGHPRTMFMKSSA